MLRQVPILGGVALMGTFGGIAMLADAWLTDPAWGFWFEGSERHPLLYELLESQIDFEIVSKIWSHESWG